MDGRSAPRSEIGDRDLARVRELYDKTLRYRDDDPEVALSQARKAAEAICKQIHRAEGLDAGGRPTTKMMLQELIQALRREGLLPRHIAMPLGTIQQYGNFGVHDQGADAEHITSEFIRPCVTALETVVDWYFDRYDSSPAPSPKPIPTPRPPTEPPPDTPARSAPPPAIEAGEDVYIELTVSKWEAFWGCEKTVPVQHDGRMRELVVKVPSRIKPGQKLRLKGMGERSVPGGARGNLYVDVHVGPQPEPEGPTLEASIGIEAAGGEMAVLLPRGTKLPASKEEVFSTAEDNQSEVFVRVYRGEATHISDNVLIASFELDGIPPARSGVPQVSVRFQVDEAGKLQVTTRDLGTGRFKIVRMDT